MIIGTAGHIDHGKSTLVAALTGRRMDRLAEERRRGITIDLNFAPLFLEGLEPIGIIDVPGHEDFVRTMVAGSSGIDAVLLVVDALEGPMPQTLEHLAIVEQLGIPYGIPVVTKADLADPEWVALVSSELEDQLGGSSVAFGPPVVVSATTGLGLDTLRERIRSLHGLIPPRDAQDAFRLPVDRAFSVAGTGTVVTGTAWSGAVSVGDHVRVLPSDQLGRVRSIEIHSEKVDRSVAGARLALGLAGVERVELHRGDVVLTDHIPWQATSAIDAAVHLLAGASRPLVSRTRVRVHVGTAELMGRIRVSSPIAPGESGIARISFERPTVVRGGDRFVLRSYSPVATIGGGLTLDPIPPRRERKSMISLPPPLEGAQRLRMLVMRRALGVAVKDLTVLAGLPSAVIDRLIREDSSLDRIEEWVIGGTRVEELGRRTLSQVTAFHASSPGEAGLSLGTLREQLRVPPRLADAIIQRLVDRTELRVADGIAALNTFKPVLVIGDAELDVVAELLARAGLEPPSVSELRIVVGREDLPAILKLGVSRGLVVAVERDRYFHRSALARFTAIVQEIGTAGVITPGAIRDRLGLSRKFLIPLLEWADRDGLTRREREGRVLLRKH